MVQWEGFEPVYRPIKSRMLIPDLSFHCIKKKSKFLPPINLITVD